MTAPLLLLLSLLSIFEARSVYGFVPHSLPAFTQSFLWAESSDDNEKYMPDNGTNKKKYDVGSGRNKPLDHLRKTDSNTTSLTDVEFWGAGYIQEGGQLGARRTWACSSRCLKQAKTNSGEDI